MCTNIWLGLFPIKHPWHHDTVKLEGIPSGIFYLQLDHLEEGSVLIFSIAGFSAKQNSYQLALFVGLEQDVFMPFDLFKFSCINVKGLNVFFTPQVLGKTLCVALDEASSRCEKTPAAEEESWLRVTLPPGLSPIPSLQEGPTKEQHLQFLVRAPAVVHTPIFRWFCHLQAMVAQEVLLYF